MIINSNRPTFFGDDGEPLKLGYIYVGLPDQDPEEFPKEVTFIDSNGGEFTAFQPLRTNSDGRIAYQGKAIKTKVEGNYSLLIKSSSEVIIRDGYLPNVEEIAGGGSDADLSSYRKYYANLATLKNDPLVEVGDTVGNFGLIDSIDGEGENWIVINATGSPGNDVDLIDFSNGLQGRKLPNFLKDGDLSNQPMTIWTGSSSLVSRSDILSASGFAMIPGVYLLETRTTDKTQGPIHISSLDITMEYIAENRGGGIGKLIEWREDTEQFRIFTGTFGGAGTNLPIEKITYVPYIG